MNSRGDIRAALMAIADRHGGKLTPDLVVEAARDPDSPLHGEFTWDDAVAARERRIEQARTLIRVVKIEVLVNNHTISAPAFLRDPAVEAGQQGYVALARLRTDEDMAREALIAEFARAAAALTRARTVAMALGFSQEVETLLERVTALQGRVEFRASA